MSEKNLSIPIILGTGRLGRQSEKVAKFVLAKILKSGFNSEIIDARDFRTPATDRTGQSVQAKKLARKIIESDGLVIVLPEYNYGYPGELKMMLDLLYEEYAGKPVAFCGVSAGGLGGVRAVEQLKLVALGLKMTPISEAVYFSNVLSLFDQRGNIQDTNYIEKVEIMLKELIRHIQEKI